MSEVFDKDGPDKDLPDEQQLDEYLRGGSDVSRQYRQLRSAEVPAELDRLVMQQAQEAVKARPVPARPAKSRTWMRWTGPLALAASAVLVVSIVIESGVQQGDYLAVSPASAPAELPTRQKAAEPAPTQDNATAGNSESSVVHISPVSPTAAPEMNFVPPPAVSLETPAPFEDRAAQASKPAPVAPQFTSEPPPKVQMPAPELLRRERVEAVAQASSTRPAPAPVHAAVAPEVSTIENNDLAQEVVITGMKRTRQAPTAGPRNTVAAPAADATAASDTDEQEREPRDYSDPEHWLRDIRELRKQNKHEAADREWRSFRYVYPNYQVAEDDTARGAIR